jgi:hypothetical protein
MPKRSAANTSLSSVWLSDVDVQLIQTIAIHKYMSALVVHFVSLYQVLIDSLGVAI